MSPFGAVARGEGTERKKATGRRMAARGMVLRTTSFIRSESRASST